MNRRTSLLLLAAFCLFALFWRLGSCGLTEPDEGRTAGIGLEFHQSGTWLVPRLYELAQFNKPPLVYWACSVAYGIAGVNEWAARLPAALAAFGTLLLTWSLARRLFGEPEAFAAVLILLTAPMFFVMARIIDPNMMLTFWITLTMRAAVAWFQDGKKFQQWLFWLALGVAFLAKGPPALGVVGLALAGFKFASRKGDAGILPAHDGSGLSVPTANAGAGCPGSMQLCWRPLLNLPAILACLVLGLSWYIASAAKYPELWKFFLGQELVGRLSGTIAGRSQPFWFFLPIVLGGFLPWIPSVVSSLADAVQRIRHDGRVRLLLCWVVLPFLMFSLSKSKLPAYILPLFPPLAMLAGARVAACLDRRWLRLIQFPLAILLGWLLPSLLILAGSQEFGWDRAGVLQDIIWQSTWMGLAMLAVGMVLIFRGIRQVAGLAAVLAFGYLAGLGLLARHENEIGAHSSPRKMCAALQSAVQPGDRVILYRKYPRGVGFYLNHPLSFSDKYEPQIDSDWALLANRLYKESDLGIVYRWVDHEPRVFVITTALPRGGIAGKDKSPLDFLRDGCRKPLREVYRDGKYVVVANF